MNKNLIKKLRKGTIAVVNDGTLEELRKVLKYAFPYDYYECGGGYKYYFKFDYDKYGWNCSDETNLPIHSVKEFLTEEKQIMSTIVNINPDTSEINITPKEGFEIDLENSDLKNGKVLFKEVEKKYPNAFFYCEKAHGKLIKTRLSPKYVNKLSILDTLLCIRDEYNRIDGFTEGFRFGESNWRINNFNDKLRLDEWSANNKPMRFRKEETAELFLKNFEKQLETVKEFL